jgi:peroxiredoxin
MNRLHVLRALPFLLCAAGGAIAGQYNQVLSIGDPAPSWVDLDGVDGRAHSLDDLADKKVVVVVFTCNSCPYAVDVEDRLIALDEKYSRQGVAVVAINVNQVKEDLPEAMKAKAEAKGFRFPYLYDESQKIARDFGAIYTPEFYVLDQQRKIAYMGSIDDSPSGKEVTKKYVEAAIDALLAGDKPSVTETVPIGCSVRYQRQRRSRRKPGDD